MPTGYLVFILSGLGYRTEYARIDMILTKDDPNHKP